MPVTSESKGLYMHCLNYEERRKHGTEEFPLEYYSVDERHPRYSMPFHWHNETELLYVLKGEFKLFLDSNEYHLYQGDLCYIPSGAMHGGEGTDCTYECIDFDAGEFLNHPPLVRRYLGILENEHYQIQNLFSQQHPGILKCASRMFLAARNQDEGWEMLVLAGLYDFFGTVIQKDYRIPVSKGKNEHRNITQINKTIDYIAGHYKEHISLNDLAGVAALSPQYFCMYFRAVTGKSPMKYLNYYRVERACYLLEQKNSTVTGVALDCGFNDVGYFIRCFKKHKGITPYQYMKDLQDKGYLHKNKGGEI